MRARHFLALVAAGLTAAVGVGCDGNADGTGGGGSGGDGGTGGTTTTSTTTTTTTTTTGTGGTVGDGNDTFDTAEDLPLAEELAGTLDPAASDSDFYMFEGEANAPFIITTTAKIGNDPFDPTYLDLVVTLYDANKKIIGSDNALVAGNDLDAGASGLFSAKVYETAGTPESYRVVAVGYSQ